MLMKFISEFIWNEEGVTAIEYGLIASLIALIIVAAATQVGTSVNGFFSYLADCINAPTTAC